MPPEPVYTLLDMTSWRHARRAKEMYAAISNLPNAIVVPEVCKYGVVAVRMPLRGIVVSHKVCVIASDSWASFVIYQSSIHSLWAWNFGGRQGAALSYVPSRCYTTFPPPQTGLSPVLSQIGCELHQLRGCAAVARDGLTNMYNRFHNPAETAADIARLRALHVEMDHAVAAAYGWTDLDLGHGFHETKQGLRFTISEPARREVLGRLLRLNHERYAEEVAQGLHEKGRKPGKGIGRRGRGKDAGLPGLE